MQLLQWFAQIWHRPKHLLISLLKMSPRSIVTHHLSSIGCFLILEEQKDIVRTQICHMHWQYRLPTHDWTPPELPCLVTPVFGIDHVLLSIWRADRRETVHQTAGHQTPTVWLPDKGLDSENDWRLDTKGLWVRWYLSLHYISSSPSQKNKTNKNQTLITSHTSLWTTTAPCRL